MSPTPAASTSSADRRRASTAAGDQFWSQDTAGVAGEGEAHDRFGFSLAAADFDGARRHDLAIGAPGEDRDGVHDTGIVHVLYGAPAGLTAASDEVWSQGTAGIAGDPEPNDRFGTALAAGRFNGAGAADLAIGAPWDSVAGIREIGTVNVLYGTRAGLDDAGDDFWHQRRAGVAGTARGTRSVRRLPRQWRLRRRSAATTSPPASPARAWARHRCRVDGGPVRDGERARRRRQRGVASGLGQGSSTQPSRTTESAGGCDPTTSTASPTRTEPPCG